MQVSINMLRYGLGRSQSVPLQLGLAAAIRAAATASPATAVAAVDFMRYTESHLAEALAERHSSSADRCTLGQYSAGQRSGHMLVRCGTMVREALRLLGSDGTAAHCLCSRFISLEESPRLYAGLLTTREGLDPWSVVAAAADGMAGILRRAQVERHSSSICATIRRNSHDARLGRITHVVSYRLHLPCSTRWPMPQLASLHARGRKASS